MADIDAQSQAMLDQMLAEGNLQQRELKNLKITRYSSDITGVARVMRESLLDLK